MEPKARDSDEKVFAFSQQDFFKAWNQAKATLGLTFLGPPHELRHVGAARDIEQKTRFLEEVRRRGRWSMLASQRYTKTWLLVQQRSRVDPKILERGKELVEHRGQRELHN